MTLEYKESGLAARLLVTKPPERLKTWNDRVPAQKTTDYYAALVDDLLALEPGRNGPKLEPVPIGLTNDALMAWSIWYDAHNQRIADAAIDFEKAILSKLEAYALRFALIFALVENPNAEAVSRDILCRGCGMADWFANEMLRVYGFEGESDEDRNRRQLAAWIGSRGGCVTPRELTHDKREFRDRTGDAEKALNDLVEAGFGKWVASGGKPGRPTKRFRLTSNETVTETPVVTSGIRGNGDGDDSAGDVAPKPSRHDPIARSRPKSATRSGRNHPDRSRTATSKLSNGIDAVS